MARHIELSERDAIVQSASVDPPDLKHLSVLAFKELSRSTIIPTNDRLSFFQRYFTRAAISRPDQISESTRTRRFAFTAKGTLIVAAGLFLILLAGTAAAVAKGSAWHSTLQNGASDHPAGTTPSQPTDSPIRTALLENFPDPDILHDNGTWYAFATNNAAGILDQQNEDTQSDYGAMNVQVATSTDFRHWTLAPVTADPLPHVGAWAVQGLSSKPPRVPLAGVWAPAILQRPLDDKYVMYYSAVKANAEVPGGNHPPPHCIGASQANNPKGPFKPIDQVLACPVSAGGAIDPAPFIDHDRTIYLVYKVDGNNAGHGGICGNTVESIIPTPILLQKLHANGTAADGPSMQILDRSDEDGPLVEAPQLVRSHQGVYFLFYSSGCTRTPTYTVRYATSTKLTGPYARAVTPLLKTYDYGLEAPGSAGIAEDGKGGFNMAFHARVNTSLGAIRAMFTTTLSFDGTNVTISLGQAGG